jgi:hypothetical protein
MKSSSLLLTAAICILVATIYATGSAPPTTQPAAQAGPSLDNVHSYYVLVEHDKPARLTPDCGPNGFVITDICNAIDTESAYLLLTQDGQPLLQLRGEASVRFQAGVVVKPGPPLELRGVADMSGGTLAVTICGYAR